MNNEKAFHHNFQDEVKIIFLLNSKHFLIKEFYNNIKLYHLKARTVKCKLFLMLDLTI